MVHCVGLFAPSKTSRGLQSFDFCFHFTVRGILLTNAFSIPIRLFLLPGSCFLVSTLPKSRVRQGGKKKNLVRWLAVCTFSFLLIFLPKVERPLDGDESKARSRGCFGRPFLPSASSPYYPLVQYGKKEREARRRKPLYMPR